MRSFLRIPDTELAIYESELREEKVRVALTGVGGVRAKRAMQTALEWQPDICIAAGLAGSLCMDYSYGRILVAREIVELESGRRVAADAELLRRADANGATVLERLLTSSGMILSTEGKKRLGSIAGAVEMESFAVATEASEKGIPTVAIRAISDAADENLPMDFNSLLDEKGNVSIGRTLRALAQAPHKLPALARLGRHSRMAALKLAKFLEGYVTQLAGTSRQRSELAEMGRA